MKKKSLKRKSFDLSKCKHLIGKAVVVRWNKPENDWNYFRLERIDDNSCCLSGMTDDNGVHHVGDFFRADEDEIRSIAERDC